MCYSYQGIVFIYDDTEDDFGNIAVCSEDFSEFRRVSEVLPDLWATQARRLMA